LQSAVLLRLGARYTAVCEACNSTTSSTWLAEWPHQRSRNPSYAPIDARVEVLRTYDLKTEIESGGLPFIMITDRSGLALQTDPG